MKEYLEFTKEMLSKQREDVLSPEETYMFHAVIASLNSRDPSTQVGVCYVSEDGNVLSVGCNGAPKGWDSKEFPWTGNVAAFGEIYTKYPYVAHAEMNGIANFKGDKDKLINATAYVTLFPCPNCALNLIQHGIKRVVYLSDKYHDKESSFSSRTLLRNCGIEVVSFNEMNNLDSLSIDLYGEEPVIKMLRPSFKLIDVDKKE